MADASAPLHVFAASLAHETNTFSPLPTTLRSFREGLLQVRREGLTPAEAQRFLPTYTGLFAAAAAAGDRLSIGLSAWAQPAGPISRVDYEALRDRLLDDLIAVGSVDAVVLVLHGAMVAEGYPDCEGDLLQRVRAIVGPRVPIGALLDLHGNISSAMIHSGAALVACKEYPHIDFEPRGRELYAIVAASARRDIAIRTVMRRVPMLALLGTTEGPMRSFVERLRGAERAPVLSVSAMHGFPWSDTIHTGACILAVCEEDATAIASSEALVARLAAAFYEIGTSLPSTRLPLDVALDAALARVGDGLVVLADGSDNPGGGAACDSTFVLEALIERDVRSAALGMIWDPQAVSIAADAGVGARLPLRIGGKVGPMSGRPVDVDVEVMACRDDARQRGLEPGSYDALGRAVALRVGGIDIVLNTVRQQVFSPDCFTQLGIDVAAKELVVVKSTQHFRTGFDEIGATAVYCDAPGSLNGRLRDLPYRYLRRPMWPLDCDGGHA